jgi:hypothetical protein
MRESQLGQREAGSVASIAAHSLHEDIGVSLVLFFFGQEYSPLTIATLRPREEVSYEAGAREISF